MTAGPQRLVSLCPSLTELVVALGCGNRLVGRTKFCVHPPAALGAIETLGGTKDPRLARIVELAPDLVLMNAEENRREDFEALHERGIACHTSLPKSPEDAASLLRELGARLGVSAVGEHLALELEAKLEALRGRAHSGTRCVALIWRRPWMAIGPDTYASRLLAAAGGVNACPAGSERYPELSASELVAAHPQRVLLLSEPFPFAERHLLELLEATGFERARFRFADGRLLTWHGPSTARALDHAAQLLTG